MAVAVADFLRAAGFDPDQDEALGDTPRLVASAWAEEFLDGYQRDPGEPLRRERIAAQSPGSVVIALDELHFVGVCPHHLLPYRGTARIAYLSRGHVAGFGAFVQALDALAHRFTLQEVLAQELADTIRTALDARAVLVRLDAEQGCLSLRGENRPGARAICEAISGDGDGALQRLRGAFGSGADDGHA
jgi:GTP cyclohydrolase I